MNRQWDKTKIGQLKQENVKLKNEIKELRKSYKWHMARIWEQEQTIEYQRKENVDWEEQYRSLATENDKLREQVTQLQSDWESERDYADQMEAKEMKAVAENAKLREWCSELL